MVQIKKTDKKILVTSALPYVNNIPHLGNIIGCVLSADVFARAMRSMGQETLYICGTDEHGTATETKALQEGLTPQEICDKYYKIHKDIYDWFNINFDYFGRTSSKNHHKITQELFKKVKEGGFLEEKEVEQTFCETCDKFLADRFVNGTCPYCGFEEAKGDQCDNCGKLLTPAELLDPKCSVCKNSPIKKKTKHLFLKLDELQPELEVWSEAQSKEGKWTENAIRTTNAWFKEGLRPRAITRDLKWGIPVPEKGYEDKVFYVWFDAPIGYISITEDLLGEKHKDWWMNPENTLLYQFMAKDNIPFHTIIFPASLKASREDYTLLHHINSTEYLNYEDSKFSKSRGTGVFGDDAKATGIPSDIYRYYLISNRPEGADTIFNWQEFKDKLNNELVASFGNLINRTTTFIEKFSDSELRAFKKEELSEKSKEFWESLEEKEQELTKLFEEVKLKEAIKKFMSITHLGNQYFQERQPWKTIKEQETIKDAQETLYILANLCKDLAIMVKPFMPDTSKNIFNQLNIDEERWDSLGELSIKDQHKIGTPKILFEKMEDSQVKEFREKFGNQEVTDKNKSKKEEKKESQEEKETKKDKDKNNKNNKKDKKKKEKVYHKCPEKIDLIVAKITKVEKHPDAEKLYIEKLDDGSGKERTIVSGLVPYYKAEDLKGKQIILVNNLKPAKLRGILSQGMLLAADHAEDVEVLFIPEDIAKPGDKIIIGEFDEKIEKPEQIIIDEFFANHFKVENHHVFCEDHELKVNKEFVRTEKIVNGKVR